MLLMLHRVSESLATWAEACPCHEEAFAAKTPRHIPRGRRKQKFARLTGTKQLHGGMCRAMGKRAPEMVAGKYQEVFSKAVKVTRSSMELHSKWCLTEAEWV
eukprot:4334351-Lingulodinium_polyedra.AAC.1